MNKVIFTGVPGSGKGTQAKLMKQYGIQHLSTGDLIREGFRRNDPILMQYKEHIDAGGFLPDEGIFDLIQNNIQVGTRGYILDGAVRTLPQAYFVKERSLASHVIYFHLTEAQATERLLARQEGRPEDSADAIKTRFDFYNTQTVPAENYLRQNFKFLEIDASQSVESIHNLVKTIMGEDRP